jgi:uncharacterized protein
VTSHVTTLIATPAVDPFDGTCMETATPPREAAGRNATAPMMGQRSSLLWFVGLAFVWSWTLWGLGSLLPLTGVGGEMATIAGRFGPTGAAFALAVAIGGRRGVRELLAPLSRWRAPAHLWAITLLGPVAVVLSAIALTAAMGERPGTFNDPATAYMVLPAFVTILVVGGPLGEEIGWRGFALDPLQVRAGPVLASVVLGMVWGLWHLPLFLDPGQIQHALPLMLYLGQTTSTAVIYTWLWNRTRSLPVVITLHTMTNLVAGAFPLLRPDAPSNLAFGVAVALAGGAALVLILATRGRLGWTRGEPRTGPVPDGLPPDEGTDDGTDDGYTTADRPGPRRRTTRTARWGARPLLP